MNDANIDHLLEQIEQLKVTVEAMKPRPASPQPVCDPGKAVCDDGEMPPQVAELLRTIQNHMIEPAAREDGYTLVFSMVERRRGQGQTAVISSTSEADIEKTLVPDDELVRFATAFSNPARLKIMRELANGQRSSAELSDATGLVGGQLYHHLKELVLSGLVEQKARNAYALTVDMGKPGYLGMNLLASTVKQGAERARRRAGGDLE